MRMMYFFLFLQDEIKNLHFFPKRPSETGDFGFYAWIAIRLLTNYMLMYHNNMSRLACKEAEERYERTKIQRGIWH